MQGRFWAVHNNFIDRFYEALDVYGGRKDQGKFSWIR
jgi:hypothetical protein